MTLGHSPDIVRDGLILYLDSSNVKSYSGTGTNWNDLSGNNLNALLTNGPIFSVDNNGVFNFDGTNDSAYVPSSSLFAFGTGDFTLEVWIKPQSFSGYLHLLALPNQNIFALKANTGTGEIYYYDPSYSTYGSTSGWNLVLNAWHQVVFKRQSSTGYAFLNAIPKGSKSGFTTNFTSQQLNIHNGWASEFVPCQISNIKIYNRSLFEDEITKNFNAMRSRYNL